MKQRRKVFRTQILRCKRIGHKKTILYTFSKMSSMEFETTVTPKASLNDYYKTKEKFEQLRPLLTAFSTIGPETGEILQMIDESLTDYSNLSSRVKIGGKMLAFVGFGLAAVTAGASMVLSLAGGAIGGAGLAAVTSASKYDHVISDRTLANAKKTIKRYEEILSEMLVKCREIEACLKSISDIKFLLYDTWNTKVQSGHAAFKSSKAIILLERQNFTSDQKRNVSFLNDARNQIRKWIDDIEQMRLSQSDIDEMITYTLSELFNHISNKHQTN